MACCCSAVGVATDRHFDQQRAAKDLASYRSGGPGQTARLLLEGLSKASAVRGRLLDVGSGVGAVTFELLDRGMTSAVGVDLSSAHVAAATEESARRGRTAATRFVHGDFLDLAAQLPPADVITLDRVVCCYPDFERLLTASLGRTSGYFAFSYPRDVWYVHAGVWLENLGRRIARDAFRAFVHPVPAMERVIRESGFTRVDSSCTGTWCADVYIRERPLSA
jgi:SAM-dependent methyltransferase